MVGSALTAARAIISAALGGDPRTTFRIVRGGGVGGSSVSSNPFYVPRSRAPGRRDALEGGLAMKRGRWRTDGNRRGCWGWGDGSFPSSAHDAGHTRFFRPRNRGCFPENCADAIVAIPFPGDLGRTNPLVSAHASLFDETSGKPDAYKRTIRNDPTTDGRRGQRLTSLADHGSSLRIAVPVGTPRPRRVRHLFRAIRFVDEDGSGKNQKTDYANPSLRLNRFVPILF